MSKHRPELFHKVADIAERFQEPSLFRSREYLQQFGQREADPHSADQRVHPSPTSDTQPHPGNLRVSQPVRRVQHEAWSIPRLEFLLGERATAAELLSAPAAVGSFLQQALKKQVSCSLVLSSTLSFVFLDHFVLDVLWHWSIFEEFH